MIHVSCPMSPKRFIDLQTLYNLSLRRVVRASHHQEQLKLPNGGTVTILGNKKKANELEALSLAKIKKSATEAAKAKALKEQEKEKKKRGTDGGVINSSEEDDEDDEDDEDEDKSSDQSTPKRVPKPKRKVRNANIRLALVSRVKKGKKLKKK